ncbi:MAG: hypothetical protein KBE04_07240 [Phycisphaerae bacterium]|nr:hypothetical protein [Phycisphaerae bacterium]
MNMTELALRFTQAAAHVLWAGAVIALAVFAVERLFVRTAAGRHGLHLTGLILLALSLPAAFVLTPAPTHRGVSGYPAIGAETTFQPTGGESSPTVEVPVSASLERPHRPETTECAAAPPSPQAAAKESVVHWEAVAPWAASGYLVGLIAMLVRMAFGLAGTTRLRRQGVPVEAGVWIEAMQRMGDQIHIRLRPALQWSREVAAPVLVGFLKPVILLPLSLASRLSVEQVEAVLAHELAHLLRRDAWALAVQRWVETVLFFHPAVWWMSRRMTVAREEACDDWVLAAGCDPADYAEALVICSECRSEENGPSCRLSAQLALAGDDRDLMRRRVLRLIGAGDDGAIRLGRTGWVLGLLLVGGAALAALAGNAGRTDLEDLDLENPPSAYEKGIRVADRTQRFKVDGLPFHAGPLRWEKEGWLRLPGDQQGPGEELFLNLGVSGGYEIVEVRLFDHATRRLIHDTAWQHPGEQTRDFFVERIGSTNWLRMKELGGVFPDRLDVWLRIAVSSPGKTLVLGAKEGASAPSDASEIVVASLLEGGMNGKGSGPDGPMLWDLSTAQDQDRRTTVNLENRGDLLRGRYHLVAVKKDGSRHPMDHTHFWDFKTMNRHAYFLMDVALPDVDHFELVPFKDRDKFFFNGLEVPRDKLPELSRSMFQRIESWASEVVAGGLSEADFLQRVKQAGPQAVRGLVPLMKSGGTDVLAIKGVELFLDNPAVADHLAGVLRELGSQPVHRSINTRHCCLVLLGESKARRHVGLIAGFIESNDIAAIIALSQIGGDEARDHLLGALDRIPTDHWWLLAQQLERLGDTAALPELKRRLAMIELPPSDRFPNATVSAFTHAIAVLSGEDAELGTTGFSQGQHFRYPFDGPGLPKTFSVNPLRDHFVRLPEADPNSESGRAAIWKALEDATEGPGFTMDGKEIVVFHGLKLAPLWPDGPPYPTTLYDWLRRTSHQDLLRLVEGNRHTGRYTIPDNGLLVALDPSGRLTVLSLRKTGDDFTYNVSVMPQDPSMQLIPAGTPSAVPHFTETRVCTLHDLESGAEDGSLNLSRGHMEAMTQEQWRRPPADAILVAEFASNTVGLGIAGARRFLLAEATKQDGDVPEQVLSLLQHAAIEPDASPAHPVAESDGGLFHTFSELQTGQRFAFAVQMPTGHPVAGVMEVQKVDRRAQTLEIRHRFLSTAAAREVFASSDGGPWGEPTDGVQVRIRSPRQVWSQGELLVILQTDLQSQTERVFPHYGPPIAEFVLVLDGHWYETKDRGAAEAASVGPSPALQRLNLHTAITSRHWRSMSTGEPMPDPAPGRHTFRIVFPLSAGDPAFTGDRPLAVSNPVEIDILPRDDRVSVTGRVIGVDGKPASVYRVTALPQEWSASWGLMPQTMTSPDGTFSFNGLPDGPCDVSATPVPLTDQPNLRIQGIVLKKGEPVHVTLSLEEKYSYGGRFTDAAGRPQPGRNVLAIWKDPAGRSIYSSNTKTDSEGRYRFQSPFETAERILINDGDFGDKLERRDVRSGREDVDFQRSARGAPTAQQAGQRSGFDDTVERSDGPDVHGGTAMLVGEASAGTSEFRKVLPSGITVELLGVCEDPGEPKQWWRPDGRRLERGPFARSTCRMTTKGLSYAAKVYGIAYRVTGNRYGYETSWVDQSTGSGRGMMVDASGKNIYSSEMDHTVQLLPEKLESASMTFGFPREQWQVRMKVFTEFGGFMETTFQGQRIVLNAPRVEGDKVEVVYSEAFGETARGFQTEYGLIYTRNGQEDIVSLERFEEDVSDNNQTGMRQHKFTVDCDPKKGLIEASASEITGVCLRYRPLTFVTFRNISLRPGVRTDVEITTEEWNNPGRSAEATAQGTNSVPASAGQPRFAIYLVLGHTNAPHFRSDERGRILFSEAGNGADRFDAMRPQDYPLEGLILDEQPLLTEADLTAYDRQQNLMRLKAGVFGRFPKPSVWGVPFVVVADGQRLFLGAFWTGLSSYSANVPTLSLDRWGQGLPADDPDYLPPDAVRLENRQVLREGDLPRDPRQDERLYRALQAAGKLVDVGSADEPWGEVVHGVGARLRTERRPRWLAGYPTPWVLFDLKNDSEDWEVTLNAGGTPTEVLVDGVLYQNHERVAGQLPVSKPGQEAVGATLILDKRWVAVKTASGATELDLKPGKHEVQAIARALRLGDPAGQPVRVFSNPIEIEIVPAEPHRL